MEAAGLVIGLAGLVSTCLDCIDLARDGCSLGQDFVHLHDRLENLRFDGDYDRRLDEPVVKKFVWKQLDGIWKNFLDADKLSFRYKAKAQSPLDLGPHGFTKEVLHQSRQNHISLIKRTQQQVGYGDLAKWVFNDKKRLEKVVDSLGHYIGELEFLVPKLDLLANHETVVEIEIQSVSEYQLESLAVDSAQELKVISDAASERLYRMRSASQSQLSVKSTASALHTSTGPQLPLILPQINAPSNRSGQSFPGRTQQASELRTNGMVDSVPSAWGNLVTIQAASETPENIAIICVPEPGGKVQKSAWMGTIGHILSCERMPFVQVMVFKYQIPFTGSLWTSLLEQSDVLNRSCVLYQEHRQHSTNILYICHGLGGIIVKHAVHQSYSHAHFHGLTKYQRGVLFLGTPHLTNINRKYWSNIILMLRTCGVSDRAVLAQAELERGMIRDVCSQFAGFEPSISILSVFETKRTISLRRTTMTKLVPRKFAKVGHRSERLVACDADHADICKLMSRSELVAMLVSLIQSLEASVQSRVLAVPTIVSQNDSPLQSQDEPTTGTAARSTVRQFRPLFDEYYDVSDSDSDDLSNSVNDLVISSVSPNLWHQVTPSSPKSKRSSEESESNRSSKPLYQSGEEHTPTTQTDAYAATHENVGVGKRENEDEEGKVTEMPQSEHHELDNLGGPSTDTFQFDTDSVNTILSTKEVTVHFHLSNEDGLAGAREPRGVPAIPAVQGLSPSQPHKPDERATQIENAAMVSIIPKQELAPLKDGTMAGAADGVIHYSGSFEAHPSRSMIQTVVEWAQHRDVTTLPQFIVPSPRNQHFQGREDVLHHITAAFDSNTSQDVGRGPRSFAICGLGGIGKSQIALEYAYRRSSHFSAVLWVRAETEASLSHDMQDHCIALGLLRPGETDHAMARQLLMGFLSHTDENWLLVFDNAEDVHLLHDFWPLGSTGSILITTRLPPASWSVLCSETFDTDTLPLEESMALLPSLLGRPMEYSASDDMEDCRKLVTLLAGLPLAIAQMAGVIVRRKTTVTQFLDLYKKSKGGPSKADSQGSTGKWYKMLEPIWDVTFDSLSDPAYQLLCIVSVLDPDRISIDVLRGGYGDDSEFYSILTELLDHSLVRQHVAVKTLSIHRLVQEVARSRMSPKELSSAFMIGINLLSKRWPGDELQFVPKAPVDIQSRSLLPHIVRLQQIHQAQSATLSITPVAEVRFLKLMQRAGWQIKEDGQLDVAFSLLSFALDAATKSERHIPQIRADLLFSISALYADCNKPQQCLEFAERHHSMHLDLENDSGISSYLSELAHSQLALGMLLNGEPEEALQLCKEAHSIAKNLADYREGQYWPNISSQAWALLSIGRGNEAISMLEPTLHWHQARPMSFAGWEIIMAYILQMLGKAYESQGRTKDSFKAFQQALQYYRQTTRPTSFRSNHVCIKLAEHYATDGQFETAGILFDRAINSFEAQKTYYSPDLARALHRKGLFLGRTGDTKSAQQVEEGAKELFFELQPEAKEPNKVLVDADYDRLIPIWAR